mmetsp:Transcript_3515/g.7995  ORF Transcript_3515/g.7995 Transcript_3515/m.7995 type:complete len:242 (+) Transcript_3515:303-1028(+)
MAENQEGLLGASRQALLLAGGGEAARTASPKATSAYSSASLRCCSTLLGTFGSTLTLPLPLPLAAVLMPSCCWAQSCARRRCSAALLPLPAPRSATVRGALQSLSSSTHSSSATSMEASSFRCSCTRAISKKPPTSRCMAARRLSTNPLSSSNSACTSGTLADSAEGSAALIHPSTPCRTDCSISAASRSRHSESAAPLSPAATPLHSSSVSKLDSASLVLRLACCTAICSAAAFCSANAV